MLATLFVIIFITFIGVGLPDSILGTAWPVIYKEFNLPISLAGYISAVVSVGTIISSLLSARLIRRFGTGLLSAVCTLLTAVSLLGFALTRHVALFFVLALPLGLGAGSIDTALNSFVALHYNAAKMSFLHCFYGLGVAASPFIMSLALGNTDNWRRGYLVVALLQFIITAVAFLSLPLWKKVEKKDEKEEESGQPLSILQVLKMPAARWSCFAFFSICALELTAGGWCSSFFVNTKRLNPDVAALITTLFYAGLTLGRFVSGLLNEKLGRRRILRICLLLLLCALILFLLPLWTWLSATALFVIGFAVGPVYPNLVHLTPKFFGVENSASVMAAEQAATYVGVLLMPSLFGILAEGFSTAILPAFLFLCFLLYAWALFSLLRSVKKK